MVPRRRPHPGRSLPRRQSPPAPYPARLRTGAATPSVAVVHRRRPPLRGRRRRTAGVRRVPELLQSHPDRREGPHAALRAVSRRVRGGLVGLAVASVRGVGGPPHGWDAGACPDDRTPGPGDGLRVERLARALVRRPLSGAAVGTGHLPALLAPLPHDLRDPLLEPPALFLIPGVLHRREIRLHLTVFIAVELLQLELVFLSLVDQLLHPVLIRRPGGQLAAQCTADLSLANPDRLALAFEVLLGRLQPGGLIVVQAQGGAYVRGPALADLRAQELGRVGRLLRRERQRKGDQRDEQEPLHQPSSDWSSARSCGAFRSSRLTSCAEIVSSVAGSSTASSTARSCSVDRSLSSVPAAATAAAVRSRNTLRATPPT